MYVENIPLASSGDFGRMILGLSNLLRHGIIPCRAPWAAPPLPKTWQAPPAWSISHPSHAHMAAPIDLSAVMSRGRRWTAVIWRRRSRTVWLCSSALGRAPLGRRWCTVALGDAELLYRPLGAHTRRCQPLAAVRSPVSHFCCACCPLPIARNRLQQVAVMLIERTGARASSALLVDAINAVCSRLDQLTARPRRRSPEARCRSPAPSGRRLLRRGARASMPEAHPWRLAPQVSESDRSAFMPEARSHE